MTNIVLASTCTIAGIGDTQASASTVVSTQPTRTADRTVARTPPVTTMIPPTEATATWFDVAETHDRHRDLDPVSPSRSRCALIIDRKSTRLNSSHVKISYAVFCLKKKNSQAQAMGGEANRGEDTLHANIDM